MFELPFARARVRTGGLADPTFVAVALDKSSLRESPSIPTRTISGAAAACRQGTTRWNDRPVKRAGHARCHSLRSKI